MVKISAIQTSMTNNVDENIEKIKKMVIEASGNGADLVLLPELFERTYFCQERRYDYYNYATAVNDNKAVKIFKNVAKQYKIIIPVSFFERDGNSLYNSVALIDKDGDIKGIYRKLHIPDDHYYQEKFYFKEGNSLGIFDTSIGRLGIAICWDQWFPELARALALKGAELILYPTAIGSEPILNVDSSKHWQRVMQGHSAANIVPVIAANRYGVENVEPCNENGFQSSSLEFYGSSFMTDEVGEIIEEAPKDKDAILYHEYDLDEIDKSRLSWGLFRDRRDDLL